MCWEGRLLDGCRLWRGRMLDGRTMVVGVVGDDVIVLSEELLEATGRSLIVHLPMVETYKDLGQVIRRHGQQLFPKIVLP